MKTLSDNIDESDLRGNLFWLDVVKVKKFINLIENIVLRENLGNGEKVMLIRKNAGKDLI